MIYDYTEISTIGCFERLPSLEKKYLIKCMLQINTVVFSVGTRENPVPYTFSSQTLFLNVSLFYIETPYECENAFPNFKCVPEPFS